MGDGEEVVTEQPGSSNGGAEASAPGGPVPSSSGEKTPLNSNEPPPSYESATATTQDEK